MQTIFRGPEFKRRVKFNVLLSSMIFNNLIKNDFANLIFAAKILTVGHTERGVFFMIKYGGNWFHDTSIFPCNIFYVDMKC